MLYFEDSAREDISRGAGGGGVRGGRGMYVARAIADHPVGG